MPWIEGKTPLHFCDHPKWSRGEEPMHSGRHWGCPLCGRVYRLDLVVGVDEEFKRIYKYHFTHVPTMVYVDETGEVVRGSTTALYDLLEASQRVSDG